MVSKIISWCSETKAQVRAGRVMYVMVGVEWIGFVSWLLRGGESNDNARARAHACVCVCMLTVVASRGTSYHRHEQCALWQSFAGIPADWVGCGNGNSTPPTDQCAMLLRQNLLDWWVHACTYCKCIETRYP